MSETGIGTATAADPRSLLVDWANQNDEWIRYIVRQIVATGRELSSVECEYAYALFRQEKSLDERVLAIEPPLVAVTGLDETEKPLAITRLSEVAGVNALIGGAVIEPHEGLTILFGENGTGKTGYARILKALAASRTADEILGDIDAGTPEPHSARIQYKLGDEEKEFAWAGEEGIPPFTRMSVFDSPSVNFHVDDDLEYVYVPAALALFNHVVGAIKAVQSEIETATSALSSVASTLRTRFSNDATVYPLIETLGAATDLDDLRARADSGPDVQERIEGVRRAVAALEADTMAAEIVLRQRSERVLAQAVQIGQVLTDFDVGEYNTALLRRVELESDHEVFRAELFAAADLPAEPEESWELFVASGERYRLHLADLNAHDAGRCIYCRQSLSTSARLLVGKYGEYLADKISRDIKEVDVATQAQAVPLLSVEESEVATFVAEFESSGNQPNFYALLSRVLSLLLSVRADVVAKAPVPADLDTSLSPLTVELDRASTVAADELKTLRDQSANRTETLIEKRRELTELVASAELFRSWASIEAHVRDAKEVDRLRLLARPLPTLSRGVTELAKVASNELINQSFDELFHEECLALRAPDIKVEFVGRQGRAQRRKVLTGKHKPSKVLSEGEQKVLAMADFLAEARLAGITAPVVLDDPVSSLDHRRINEVARRVALLAEQNQVIVFTHDIFFATTLLSLFEESKRCTYFQITDDEGKGKVTRATGPRWDTLGSLRKNINGTIQAAKSEDGEAAAALVRTGYDWVRAWCEVFTETELLQGVTQRYQPNVRMTSLSQIKPEALPEAIETVTRVFEDACRYIDGHSQPLPTLGVGPTLSGLEAHWTELQECRKTYIAATG